MSRKCLKPKRNDWETLEENLEHEIELCSRVLKKAKKEENWLDVIKYQEELSTVQWVLNQMEHIEETGEVL